MFEYNKKFWADVFDDKEASSPPKTFYSAGMLIGLTAGCAAGLFLDSIVPLAALGGITGICIGNRIPKA